MFKPFLIIFFAFFLLISSTVSAQEIKKSTEIEVYQGKKFYLHEVQRGETIYAIAKAYKVSVDAIAYENPDVFNGLKPGQKIRIPLQATPYTTKEHEVQKGETLYGIAKKYNTTIEELVQINPNVSNGIKPGQKLQIPVREVASADYKNDKPKTNTQNQTVTPTNQTNTNQTQVQKGKHLVQKGETIYGICKLYGISQESLYSLNPDLKNSGLQPGQELNIQIESVKSEPQNQEKPVLKDNKENQKPIITENIQEKEQKPIKDTVSKQLNTLSQAQITTSKLTDCAQQAVSPLRSVKIALFIPLLNDEALIDEEDESTDPDFKMSPKPFLEFYEGFLVAVDSIRKQGLGIELFQYEVKRDSMKIKQILADKNLQNVDLIIGPFYDNVFDIVAKWANSKGIPVINPISSSNHSLYSLNNVVQLNTTLNSQLEQVTKYLAAFDSLNVVVVHSNTADETKIVSLYKKQYVEEFAKNFPGKTALIKEVNYSQGGIDAVEKAMNKDLINVMLIPSSSQVFVINLMTKLFDETRNYKLILSYMPTWKKFEQNFELEHLFTLHTHSFQPFYIDYSKNNVKNFVLTYRDLYKIEPTKFSFLGYDCGAYFLSLLQKYGRNFYSCMNNIDVSQLSSRFYFEKMGTKGGYENKGTIITRFDDVVNDMVICNIVTNKFELPLLIQPVEIRKVTVIKKDK